MKLYLIIISLIIANCFVEPSEQFIQITSGSMGGFLTVDETHSLLFKWSKQKPNCTIDAVPLGNSTRNNTIYLYGVTYLQNKSIEELKSHPGILLNSLIHPQEKNSLVILLHTFSKLLFSPSAEEQYLLKHQVVYFIPFVNIDGVLEIQQMYRNHIGKASMMIRKNRNKHPEYPCLDTRNDGVDINRNFDFHFSELGKKSPCNEEYAGTSPFSQNQSLILKDVILTFNIKLVMDFHSYGNKLIYPYAFDKTGQMIKSNLEISQYYTKMQYSLRLSGSKMSSSYNQLGYVADGVYIDWVSSQNIRSFVYEFGLSFQDNSDNLSKSLNQSIILNILVMNQLWITADTLKHQDKWIVNIKSLGYGQIQIINLNYPLTDQLLSNINQSPTNITLKYRQSISLILESKTQQLILQIKDGDSSIHYPVKLQYNPINNYFYSILNIILIVVIILILVGLLSRFCLKIGQRKELQDNSRAYKKEDLDQTVHQLQEI